MPQNDFLFPDYYTVTAIDAGGPATRTLYVGPNDPLGQGWFWDTDPLHTNIREIDGFFILRWNDDVFDADDLFRANLAAYPPTDISDWTFIGIESAENQGQTVTLVSIEAHPAVPTPEPTAPMIMLLIAALLLCCRRTSRWIAQH